MEKTGAKGHGSTPFDKVNLFGQKVHQTESGDVMKIKISNNVMLGAIFGLSILAQPILSQVPGAGGQANSPPVPRVAQPIVNTYAQFTGGGGGHGGGYGGGFGFGGGYGYGGGSSAGSYFQGVSSLTNANAQYYFTTQQARLGKEQVENAKIANRRAKFDEDMYEKANTPTRAELEEKDRQEALRLARDGAALGDIWSGKALNTIFNSIQKTEISTRLKGRSVPISEEILRHLNLTTGTAAGSVGVFKNGAELTWPMVLRGPEFKTPRDNINRIAPDAVRQAASGSLEPDTYKKFKNAINDLGEIINNMASDLSPGDYIQSKRFANNLDEGLKNLSEPNSVNYLNGRWSAKGGTVGALMDHMTSNGLRFAPAVEGDKPSYNAFYMLLKDYDASLSQLAGK